MQIDTFGSNYNTVLAVYADAGGVMVPLGCNDDSAGNGFQSKVTFVALPTVAYYVQAGGHNGATGTLKIKAGPAPLL
jgi:hypothetical protein